MQVNDVVYCLFSASKKPAKWCRAIVQEVNGPVVKVQIWDQKKFHVRPLMIKDLKTSNPEDK